MEKKFTTPRQVFAAAARLIAKEWRQRRVDSPATLDGVIWTLVGSCTLQTRCYEILSRQLGGASLWQWNDMPNRTQAEVVALLKEAARGKFSAPAALLPEYEHTDTELLGLGRLLGLDRARKKLNDQRSKRYTNIPGAEFVCSSEWLEFYVRAAYEFVAHPDAADEIGPLSDADAARFANKIAACARWHHHWGVDDRKLVELFLRETPRTTHGTELIRAAARFVVAQKEPGARHIREIESIPSSFDPATWFTGDM